MSTVARGANSQTAHNVSLHMGLTPLATCRGGLYNWCPSETQYFPLTIRVNIDVHNPEQNLHNLLAGSSLALIRLISDQQNLLGEFITLAYRNFGALGVSPNILEVRIAGVGFRPDLRLTSTSRLVFELFYWVGTNTSMTNNRGQLTYAHALAQNLSAQLLASLSRTNVWLNSDFTLAIADPENTRGAWRSGAGIQHYFNEHFSIGAQLDHYWVFLTGPDPIPGLEEGHSVSGTAFLQLSSQ